MSDHTDAFEALGVGVTAVVYEPPELIAEFEMKYDLTFPMLSDPESSAIKTLGILNEEYVPDSRYHGVPHPGVLLIDSNGRIRAKFAESSYRKRPDFADLINASTRLSVSE